MAQVKIRLSHSLIIFAWRRLKAFFYTQPLFSSPCESVGKRLQLASM